jgi:hypothetical protein
MAPKIDCFADFLAHGQRIRYGYFELYAEVGDGMKG